MQFKLHALFEQKFVVQGGKQAKVGEAEGREWRGRSERANKGAQ